MKTSAHNPLLEHTCYFAESSRDSRPGLYVFGTLSGEERAKAEVRASEVTFDTSALALALDFHEFCRQKVTQ